MAERLGESGESSQYKWLLDNAEGYRCICKKFHVVVSSNFSFDHFLLYLFC